MSGDLLATKLFVPPARREFVPRERLIRRLNDGLRTESKAFARKLTLISAPAGYGKTTLVVDWIRGEGLASPMRADVAWFSLDEGDDDPARFLAYLAAALQSTGIKTEPGQSAAAQAHDPETFFRSLINELAEGARPFILVMDDYHRIANQTIHDALAFLLEFQPSQMHLVLLTREDPSFSLSRLRGRGEMVEIRQGDLRFTREEAAVFLNEMMALSLTPEQIETLEARTEGWIAGLQLAALAMLGLDYAQQQDDVRQFIQSFAGSSRFILDYLVEEVFRRQQEDVQRFLLETAILERLNGSLCAAITGRDDSQAVLQKLEQANLFVVPLDDSRQWYRYHQLFADLLRYRLQQEGLDTRELHHRAAGWYELNGQTAEAIRHSLAAQDWDRAADLVDHICEHMLKQGQITTLLGWLDLLPERTLRARPDLCLNLGWALALSNQLAAAERYAELVEPISEQNPALLSAALALLAYIARARHDVPRTIDLSQKALALLPPDDANARGVVGANLGVAYIYSGDLKTAVEVWKKAIQDARRSGNYHVEILALSFTGQIQAAWGKLHQAADLQQQAIRLGIEKNAAPATVRAHVNLAALLYEWNELQLAREHLRQTLELSVLGGDKNVQRDAYRLLALISQAQGDSVVAMAALEKARDLLRGDDISVSAYLATACTHLWVALTSGDLAMAMRWGQRVGDLAPQPDAVRTDLLPNAGFFSPQPGLGQASLLIAQGQKEAAAARLANCYRAAVESGFGYSQVHARVLQALSAGQVVTAVDFLADALALAQPEGYVRVFIDAGPSLRPLLSRLSVDRSPRGIFAEKLLAVSNEEEAADSAISPVPLPPNAVLVEPLSEREIEILQLLAQRYTNAEIAQALVVSPNTVKTHLRHIYEKLGVHDRWSAVARAHEIKILP